jgi:hypothetical protein
MKTLFATLLLVSACLFSAAPFSHAQSVEPPEGVGGSWLPPEPEKFVPLAGVPGFTDLDDLTLPSLIQAIYRMAIVIGALVAVLKITFAGLKYMGGDSIGNKKSAIEDIQSSLFGLLILLSTVLIINTITGGIDLSRLFPSGGNGPVVTYPNLPPPIMPQPDRSQEVDRRKGCAQTSGADSCGSGRVAVFKGSVVGMRMACESSSAVPPVTGQSTFRYATEAQCTATRLGGSTADRGNIGQLIIEGKNVYGIFEVRTRDTQPTTESLLNDCKSAGGSRVVKTTGPYVSPGGQGTVYGYVCTN